MNILITGMTALQCKVRTPLKFHGIGEMIGDAATEAGHHVDQRQIDLHEDTSQYDVLLVGISPFGSISSRRLFRILDLIMRARGMGCRLAFFVDDWRVGQFGSSIRTILGRPENLTKDAIKRPNTRLDGDWANANMDYMLLALRAFNENPWPPTIVPVHGFARSPNITEGALAKYLPSRQLAGIDVTPLARTYENVPRTAPEDRRKVWVNASLGDDTQWMKTLGFGWPIEATTKRTQVATGRLTVDKIDRRPEQQIIEYYGQVWGVLSRPYKEILGTGYWRYRFIQSAQMGNVMVCDPAEINNLEPYQYRPHQLETFDPGQLAWVAEAQHDALYAQAASRAETVAAVHDVLMGAV